VLKAGSHSNWQAVACLLYGIRRFLNELTKTRHWTLTWTSRIQFSPSIPISLRSISMLSSHLHLGLLNGLLPSGFPTEILCAFLIVSMRATYLTHVIRDFITLTIFVEACKLWSSSLCSLLNPPATSYLLGSNILLSTSFSLLWMVLRFKDTVSKLFLLFVSYSRDNPLTPYVANHSFKA